jgi:hypothetical protein
MLRNAFGSLTVIGNGPLTTRFKLVAQAGRRNYLVWADTMGYRLDGKPHDLDVKASTDDNTHPQ